ncbi:MAG: hypothetical protein CMK07_05845 [Ponticaulis sp.]|nr:hypothetical protein [Ponticaulis sp.]
MTELLADVEDSSRFALYRGVIALAWADHELHDDEKTKLHDIITLHQGLSDEQRASLLKMVDEPVTMDEIWPDITSAQHRARLIDLANLMFQQDGVICDSERELYDRFLAKHLNSLDQAAIARDIDELINRQADLREQREADLKDYARQYSLIEKIKGVFKKD